eukprot:g26028.t1
MLRTLVRPLLEPCAQFWLPSYRKDMIKLERVQKRFIRMLPGQVGIYRNPWSIGNWTGNLLHPSHHHLDEACLNGGESLASRV